MSAAPRTPERLVEEARKLQHIPFKHQGRTKEKGVDCQGLLVLAAYNAGWEEVHDIDETNYHHQPPEHYLREKLNNHLVRKTNSRDLDHGDIVLMREGDTSAHMGIIDRPTKASKTYLIHAYGPAKKVIKEPLDLGNRQIVAVYGDLV